MADTSIQNAPRIAIPLQQTPYIDKAAPLQVTPSGVDVPPEIAKGNTGNITFNGGPALLIDDPSIQDIPKLELAGKISAAFNGQIPPAIINAAIDFGEQNNMSLEDVVMTLMICQLKGALDMKSAEREMKAYLSAEQYQRGMQIADLIKDKGEKDFASALTQVTAQLVSGVGSIAARKITKALMSHGPNNKLTQTDGNANYSKVNYMTESEKMNMQQTMDLASNLTSQAINSVSGIATAALKLQSSLDDAEINNLQTANKLDDSRISSSDSTIAQANNVMQTTMSAIREIMEVAHSSRQAVISNSR